YLLMPSVTVGEGDYLYFDSYCGMESVSDTVSFTVDIKETSSDVWLPLISRETVMNDDQTFAWWQIEASLKAYEGKSVDIRFHSVTGGWLDWYNLGWYIDNIFVGP
ncbi:MAG: hypothetical protein IJR33_08305, partial [Clostridia bacterium]|nr:hypothetical protein [Clostridia bacterium]